MTLSGAMIRNDLKASDQYDFEMIGIRNMSLQLKGMSDERQNQPILSADIIARQKSVVCHPLITSPRVAHQYFVRYCRMNGTSLYQGINKIQQRVIKNNFTILSQGYEQGLRIFQLINTLG